MASLRQESSKQVGLHLPRNGLRPTDLQKVDVGGSKRRLHLPLQHGDRLQRDLARDETKMKDMGA